MRYKVVCSYDGTMYHGFQKQKNGIGVQNIIEKAFKNMTTFKTQTYGSSRTDKKVHAKAQVFHFDSDLDIETNVWKESLNRRLPLDIRIKSVSKVKNDFHARHSAKSKQYIYKIAKRESNVFNQNYEVYVKGFDFNKVKNIGHLFEGTHDFTGFSKIDKNRNPIKTIYSLEIVETSRHYLFKFHGDSFLKYMVRKIMGLIIDIGIGYEDVIKIKEVFEKKDPTLLRKTAEARGLYLNKIYY